MASNVGNVVVTVKLDDSLRERIIGTLEKARLEHFADGHEGIMACNGISSWHGPCECGADELNAEIDALIVDLKKEPKPNDLEYL